MRDIRKLGALAFIALAALPFGATAADGGVCVSQLFTTTIASPIGTINYPQLTNSTKFTCGTACGGTPSDHVGLTANIVRAGVNYRF